MSKNALRKAIKIAGGQAALARNAKVRGLSQGRLSQLLIRDDDQLSLEAAIEIERITGVPREELRPDVFKKNPGSSRRAVPGAPRSIGR